MAGQPINIAQLTPSKAPVLQPKSGRDDLSQDDGGDFGSLLKQAEHGDDAGPASANAAPSYTAKDEAPPQTAAGDTAVQPQPQRTPAYFKAALKLAQKPAAQTSAANGSDNVAAQKSADAVAADPLKTDGKDPIADASQITGQADASVPNALLSLAALTPGAVRPTPQATATTTDASTARDAAAQTPAGRATAALQPLLERLSKLADNAPQNSKSAASPTDFAAQLSAAQDPNGTPLATDGGTALPGLTALQETLSLTPQTTSTPQAAGLDGSQILAQQTSLPSNRIDAPTVKVLQRETHFAPDTLSKTSARLSSTVLSPDNAAAVNAATNDAVSTPASASSAAALFAATLNAAKGGARPASQAQGTQEASSDEASAGDTGQTSPKPTATAPSALLTGQPAPNLQAATSQSSKDATGFLAGQADQNAANATPAPQAPTASASAKAPSSGQFATETAAGSSSNLAEAAPESVQPAAKQQVATGATTAAATPPTAQPQQPSALIATPAKQIANQIVETFGAPSTATPSNGTAQATGAVRTLSLELHPADLGKVTIDLSLKDGTLALRVQSAKPETARLLQQDQDSLSKLLSQAGYKVDSLAIQAVSSQSMSSSTSFSQQQSPSQNQNPFAQSNQSGNPFQQSGQQQSQGGDGRQPGARQSRDQEATIFGGNGQTRDEKGSASSGNSNIYI